MEPRRPRRVSRFSLFEAWANSAVRKRWRIWSGLGVLCLGVALVTLASGVSQQSAPVPSTARMEASCTALSSIESRFNATPIGEGNHHLVQQRDSSQWTRVGADEYLPTI